MRVAWHPTRDEFIFAEALEREYGDRLAAAGDLYLKPMARCKVCGSRLSTIAGNPVRVGHFRHPEGVRCPTSEPAGQPYLRLTPTSPDAEYGRALRAEALERWQELYVELQYLVPYFSDSEFRILIRRAGDRNIWGYRNLTFNELPKVFVMLADYAPWTGLPGRRYWFRFWYQHDVRSIDQLWIESRATPSLFRASFKAPTAKDHRPAYDDIKKLAEHPWGRPNRIPALRRKEVREMVDWLTPRLRT